MGLVVGHSFKTNSETYLAQAKTIAEDTEQLKSYFRSLDKRELHEIVRLVEDEQWCLAEIKHILNAVRREES